MQRKQLAALCDELTENKKVVASNIEMKQTRLDNLAPQLRSILEVKILEPVCISYVVQTKEI